MKPSQPHRPGLFEEPKSKFSKKEWAISIVIVGVILAGFLVLMTSGGVGISKPPEGEMTVEWAFRDMVHEQHGYRFERITSIENSGRYTPNSTTTPSGLMCTITYQGSDMSPPSNGRPSHPEGAWPLLAWAKGHPAFVSKPGNLEVDGRRVSTVKFKADDGEFIVLSHGTPLEEIAEVFSRVRVSPSQLIWFFGEIERRGEPIGPKAVDYLVMVCKQEATISPREIGVNYRTNTTQLAILAANTLWTSSALADRRGIDAIFADQELLSKRFYISGDLYEDFPGLLTLGQSYPLAYFDDRFFADPQHYGTKFKVNAYNGIHRLREEGQGVQFDEFACEPMRSGDPGDLTRAWLEVAYDYYDKTNGRNYREFSKVFLGRVEATLILMVEQDPAFKEAFIKEILTRDWRGGIEDDNRARRAYREIVEPRLKNVLTRFDEKRNRSGVDYASLGIVLKYLQASDTGSRAWSAFKNDPFYFNYRYKDIEEFREKAKPYPTATPEQRELLEQLWERFPQN